MLAELLEDVVKHGTGIHGQARSLQGHWHCWNLQVRRQRLVSLPWPQHSHGTTPQSHCLGSRMLSCLQLRSLITAVAIAEKCFLSSTFRGYCGYAYYLVLWFASRFLTGNYHLYFPCRGSQTIGNLTVLSRVNALPSYTDLRLAINPLYLTA